MPTGMAQTKNKDKNTLDDYMDHPKLTHLITTSSVTIEIITIAKHR